jgi:hypothetical protein
MHIAGVSLLPLSGAAPGSCPERLVSGLNVDLLLLLVGGDGRLAGWQLHSPGPDCGVCCSEGPREQLGGQVMKVVVHAVVVVEVQSQHVGSSSGQQH